MRLLTESKFAYKHKPTNKWVYIHLDTWSINITGWPEPTALYYLDEFNTGLLYTAKNLIEEDLLSSEYGKDNFLEFELVEIEINYKEKS